MKKPFIKERAVHSFIGSLEFKLTDHIHYPLFSWPATPVSYCVDFSADRVRADELVLYDGSQQIPFQIAGAVCRDDGALLKADVVFITDLPSGGEIVYRLEKGTPCSFVSGISVNGTDDEITVFNQLIQIKLPCSCEYPQNSNGPVMALGDGKEWSGSSRLFSQRRKVIQIITEIIELGAVFAHLHVKYMLEADAIYTTDIRIYTGLDFLEMDEQVSGINADEQIYWRFDWDGFNPTHRYAPNNPGSFTYDPAFSFEDYPWHRIDEPFVDSFTHPMDLPTYGEHGELPFRLNVFETQNAIARNKNACFWDEHTGQSVGIFLRRSENWDNERYDIFTSWDGSAIKYYYENNKLWWRFPIANGTRSLGLTVYKHERDKQCFFDVVEKLNGFDIFPAPQLGLFAVSYTNYLENWYNTLNLDKIKEYTLTYPKNARRAEKLCSFPSFNSPEAMLEHMVTYHLVPSLPLYGASINSGFSGVPYRRMGIAYFSTYNVLYDQFTDAQRGQAEAILLLLLYLAQGECCTPMFVMHGGPPNLLADVKSCLGMTACLFPEHPDYELFLQTFEKLIPLTSKFMTRPPLEMYMLRGGRWAENIGTYTWAYLHSTLDAHAVARLLGGRKNNACSHETDRLGQWLVHSLTAPFDGDNPKTLTLHLENHRYWSKGCYLQGEKSCRLHLPQGAHSARRVPPNTMWHLALVLERYAPLTAENLRYISHYDDVEPEAQSRSTLFAVLSEREKRDNGTRPEFRSCAFTGYGIILRSAIDTKDELFVHLQQIDGGPNYRWGTAGMGGNGAIYYYAAGKAYSHNGSEEIGDAMLHDCDAGCMLGVWKGYKYCSIGPNVLENGYCDLGAFQFAKIDAEVGPDSYAWPEYQSRSITLSHSDYIFIYDEVGAPTVKTRFSWSVARYDELPNIQILSRADNRCELFTPESKTIWYHGMGNSTALVTHKEGLSGECLKGCYVVCNKGQWKDYIFRCPKPNNVNCEGIEFKGTSAAVRSYEDGTYSLALFDGSLLKYKEITIETDGINSVAVSFYDRREFTFEGRTVSLHDSYIHVNRENSADNLFIDGEKAVINEQGFAFLPKGEHTLSLTQQGHLPVPVKARILHIATGSGQADIQWIPVKCAETYTVEISRDGGTTWSFATIETNARYRLNGLENERRYHFRVTARNAEHSGEPSHEYPAYVSSDVPLPPDGLALRFTAEGTVFLWGEILGALEYVLYEYKDGGSYQEIYRGEKHSFTYNKPHSEIRQYAVAAVNLNGEGRLSDSIDDDHDSLANWMPGKESFDRNSLYNHHPFYAYNIHQFKPTPEQYPVDD